MTQCISKHSPILSSSFDGLLTTSYFSLAIVDGPLIPDTIPPTYAPSHWSQYTLQKVDQSGEYEKLLDFTRRLKFQQIINHFDDYEKLLERPQLINCKSSFANCHHMQPTKKPIVRPVTHSYAQAVKSSVWPAQFLKSNGLIWPGLQATGPTAGRPGLSRTLSGGTSPTGSVRVGSPIRATKEQFPPPS
ncbi:hypothetical protein BDD12DRAFT_802886 [Trichophaea hybrida]|nr:hypothetical protein BDD12DRAFT_802886 [Trichophaea hybrida]